MIEYFSSSKASKNALDIPTSVRPTVNRPSPSVDFDFTCLEILILEFKKFISAIFDVGNFVNKDAFSSFAIFGEPSENVTDCPLAIVPSQTFETVGIDDNVIDNPSSETDSTLLKVYELIPDL